MFRCLKKPSANILKYNSLFSDELTIALWNLYSFYRQFEEEVAQKLSQDTTQISKKLKEFVKIARWHDITYWSVKQAIEKSHRTLFKYVKEYEVRKVL